MRIHKTIIKNVLAFAVHFMRSRWLELMYHNGISAENIISIVFGQGCSKIKRPLPDSTLGGAW